MPRASARADPVDLSGTPGRRFRHRAPTLDSVPTPSLARTGYDSTAIAGLRCYWRDLKPGGPAFDRPALALGSVRRWRADMARARPMTARLSARLLGGQARPSPTICDYRDHGTALWRRQRRSRLDRRAVIKTLVMEDDRRARLVMLMHGDREVSTRALARARSESGQRAALRPDVAERHSGYKIGGVTLWAQEGAADLHGGHDWRPPARLRQWRQARLPRGHRHGRSDPAPAGPPRSTPLKAARVQLPSRRGAGSHAHNLTPGFQATLERWDRRFGDER